jgi:hypothetical protein
MYTRLLCLFAICAVWASLGGCGSSSNSERLISWTDSDGTVFTVLHRETIADSKTELEVIRNGVATIYLLDDKMYFSVVRIVVYQDWVLILDNHIVVGGWNRRDASFSESSNSKLPFTVRIAGGDIVAQKILNTNLKTSLPRGFVGRLEQRSTPPTTK